MKIVAERIPQFKYRDGSNLITKLELSGLSSPRERKKIFFPQSNFLCEIKS